MAENGAVSDDISADLVFGRSIQDTVRAVILGTVGAVPIGGSPVASVLGEFWAPLLQRRLHVLLNEYGKRLSALESEVTDAELSRDAVLSCASIAAQDAMSSDDEKIEYLACALTNVTIDLSWEHDEAVALMRLVGQLTASHIRVLDFVCDPENWQERHGIYVDPPCTAAGVYHRRDWISANFAEQARAIAGLQTIIQDLESKGLLSTVAFAVESPSDATDGFQDDLTSLLGRQILAFLRATPPAAIAPAP